MDEISPQRPGAKPLDETLLHRINLWWRAANYLSVGQIYLLGQSPAARAAVPRPRQARACSGISAPHRG